MYNDPFERAGLERFVLRHDDGAIIFAEDEMRTGLTKLNEPQTFQCSNRFRAVDIARNFHVIASTGSWEKCKRMRLGRSFGSK